MTPTSQTALERYKARRGGDDPGPGKSATLSPPQRGKTSKARSLVLLLLLLPALAFYGWRAYESMPGEPLQLTYEVDLANAPSGLITVTLMAEGKLPPELDLEFPAGVFGSSGGGLDLTRPSAHAIKENGQMGKPLSVDRIRQGWRLGTRGLDRVGFIYRVELNRTQGQETDIRKYISTPVKGGVRFAGFEVFLEPVHVAVDNITVTVHNPLALSVLVPWPALVRNQDQRTTEPMGPLADAHLGYGQGYQPAAGIGSPLSPPEKRTQPQPATPVPLNLLFHPRDLADLNNALLVCGDIRTLNSQARDCVIQFATDQNWLFRDQDALDLIRRIARTEMGFFGSVPTEQITVLLSSNDVKAADGFDAYGVHTGSSVLVMLHPETTWGTLESQAASVIAHEMFHGWLGEAIAQEDPATLWFTEGATTWYAARMLTAAGIWTSDHTRQVLTDRLNRDYVANPWRGKIPIAEAAVEIMATPDQVRYAYAGGVAACMALDQWLSGQSGMVRPLDEVLRHLYDHSEGLEFTRLSLEQAVLEVTGVDCHHWLEEFVYGTENLPPVDRLI